MAKAATFLSVVLFLFLVVEFTRPIGCLELAPKTAVASSVARPSAFIQDEARHSTGKEVKGVMGINCGAKCAYRCSKASRHKICIRACNTCCQRCHCVPPGTYGNKDVCPCYAKMTTHGGRLKCP